MTATIDWARWEELAARAAPEDLFSSRAYREAWLGAFGGQGVVQHCEPGLLAFQAMRQAERYAGLPARVLRLALNSHARRGAILVDPDRVEAAAEAMLARLRAERGIDAFRLQGLPEAHGFASRLADLARARGLAVDLDFDWAHYMLEPAAFPGFEAYMATRGASARRTMGKQMRRLERDLAATFTLHRGEAAIAAFETYLAIEKRSWKGEDGETILGDPARERFYRGLVARLAAQDQAAIDVLTANGEDMAALVILMRGQTLVGFKISFDSELSYYSPGAMLLQRFAEMAFSTGARHIDYYSSAPYAGFWASGSTPYRDITIWNANLRGRALGLARRGLMGLRALRSRVKPPAAAE